MDRLGRTAKGLTSLFDDLIRWKVNLISLKDGLDLVTPSGRLMATILAVSRPTRPKSGQRGSSLVRLPGMCGVHWGGSVRGRRIKVTVEQTISIRCLRSEGQEIAAIARGTGLSRPTIYRILDESVTPQLSRTV